MRFLVAVASLSAAAVGAVALSRPAELAGRRFLFTLDFGREKNTWMPPRWASSGMRLEVPLLVELRDTGEAATLEEGAYGNIGWRPGRWAVENNFPNERFQAYLDMERGYVRGDNALPPDTRLYLSIPVFDGQFSNREGNLSVKQRRFFFREERRLVGTFVVEREVLEGEIFNMPTSRVYNDIRNVA